VKKETILIVDDELSMREFLQIMLEKEGYNVAAADGGESAMLFIDREPYDLMLCDMKMPRVSGLDVLKRSREKYPQVPVILITAYSSSESAMEAMKVGAYDYIQKPFLVDEIKLIIQNALEKRQLLAENIKLKEDLYRKYRFESLVGGSEAMLRVYELINKVAPGKANVLISGESGTGKELVARAIHFNGPRRDMPFVTVNCGAIPENLLESELFGHKKGSFTGAVANKIGLFETARDGTIFLDEIGELNKNLQVKLLRVIQDKIFTPVGGTEEIEVDIRVISATNRDLEEEVKAGNFREDLFWRLNVIQVRLPPLWERPDDIPRLAMYFLEKYAKEQDKEIGKISAGAMALLENYDYPGNVRELENIIERAVALETTGVISPQSLPPKLYAAPVPCETPLMEIPPDGLELEKVMDELEKSLLLRAIEKADGVKTRAAELLKLSFRSFRYRLEKHGIE